VVKPLAQRTLKQSVTQIRRVVGNRGTFFGREPSGVGAVTLLTPEETVQSPGRLTDSRRMKTGSPALDSGSAHKTAFLFFYNATWSPQPLNSSLSVPTILHPIGPFRKVSNEMRIAGSAQPCLWALNIHAVFCVSVLLFGLIPGVAAAANRTYSEVQEEVDRGGCKSRFIDIGLTQAFSEFIGLC
jgi:hypothetical protein